ncbi:MAG: TIGR04282 family arsenosugar biosynthesis glycosyltransferase [Flavobacteriaceae bacterium]
MNHKNLLIIFTRNPILGKVKTRLAKTVGDKTALDIYTFLLKKTKEITLDSPCDKVVYYSEKLIKNDIWNCNSFRKEVQSGEDLGAKMKNSFYDAFENNYRKVVLIGSDIYDLESYHINEAFKKLDTNDVVMGPALDGGYYLIGLKKMHPKIFDNKRWGSSTVRKDTLKNLEKVDVHLLPVLNDVDVIEDIEHHPAFTKFL